jgi:hypothetical protein
MKKITLVFAASMLMMSASSFAQTETSNMPVVQNDVAAAKAACEKNPEACSNVKARGQMAAQNAKADCIANPDACKAVAAKARQGVQNVKAKCEGDPSQCAEVRSNVQGRQANRMGRRSAAKSGQ